MAQTPSTLKMGVFGQSEAFRKQGSTTVYNQVSIKNQTLHIHSGVGGGGSELVKGHQSIIGNGSTLSSNGRFKKGS